MCFPKCLARTLPVEKASSVAASFPALHEEYKEFAAVQMASKTGELLANVRMAFLLKKTLLAFHGALAERANKPSRSTAVGDVELPIAYAEQALLLDSYPESSIVVLSQIASAGVQDEEA